MCESPNADAIGATPLWRKNMESGLDKGEGEGGERVHKLWPRARVASI